MEQKNLDTLLNNLQRNLRTKNYFELYKSYQEVLNIDSTNIQALYSLLEVASKIDTSYFYRNEVKITVYELTDAIKTIFKSDDKELKEKAYNSYVNCADNRFFIENWTPEEKDEFSTVSGRLKRELSTITDDKSKLLKSSYYYDSTYHGKFQPLEANFLRNSPNIKRYLDNLFPKDMQLVNKLWKKRFVFMATKKICKELNFDVSIIKYQYKKFALVIGENCIFRIFNYGRIDIFVLGENLNLELYYGNLFFKPKNQDVAHELNVKVLVNQKANKKEFDAVIKKLNETGSIVKEHTYDIYANYHIIYN